MFPHGEPISHYSTEAMNISRNVSIFWETEQFSANEDKPCDKLGNIGAKLGGMNATLETKNQSLETNATHQKRYGFSRSMLRLVTGSSRNQQWKVHPFWYGHLANGGKDIAYDHRTTAHRQITRMLSAKMAVKLGQLLLLLWSPKHELTAMCLCSSLHFECFKFTIFPSI